MSGEDSTTPYSRIRLGWSNVCMELTSFTKSSNAPGTLSTSFFRILIATATLQPDGVVQSPLRTTPNDPSPETVSNGLSILVFKKNI